MRDNAGLQRFEAEENGLLVFADYRRDGDRLVIRHVEAAPALRGTGAADRLMRAIALHARENGLGIVPRCGYAAAWLRRNRAFADVLAG